MASYFQLSMLSHHQKESKPAPRYKSCFKSFKSAPGPGPYLNKNNPEGFRKIIIGIDQPRLVFFVSCDFSCDFTKLVVKTGDLSLTQLILGITDLCVDFLSYENSLHAHVMWCSVV